MTPTGLAGAFRGGDRGVRGRSEAGARSGDDGGVGSCEGLAEVFGRGRLIAGCLLTVAPVGTPVKRPVEGAGGIFIAPFLVRACAKTLIRHDYHMRVTYCPKRKWLRKRS